ncbi:MAG: peptidoglycan bridge formation glycyltransferase FemA/FemB family protein [Candidatus Shapirobacteria bacterium]|nr:peptidoglycan bridge formation glycyltransferase FemA/FemB family protein [Candidatus Shapirobacteria bacterium]
MITRILDKKEKAIYNSAIKHPIQTWEWGDFQISQGHQIYRLGVFDDKKIKSAYSVSFHKIPKTNYSIGTILRGPSVDIDMIESIKKIANDQKAVFVKFEPDVYQKTYDEFKNPTLLQTDMQFPKMVVSPKVAFYPFSYIVNLNKTEEELLSAMHSKTRYNIKIANRYGVKVEERTDDEGFEIYLKLIFDTTKRQGFYLHTPKYHRDLWKTLKNTGMVHIILASYQNQVISAFMLFTLNGKLFYPYGASLDVYREVMAPTLLMWESIKFGKSHDCHTFDMWGSLGPDAKEGDPGFGFHRFKQGYGGQMVQFVGTYDLVINESLYKIYNTADKYRWQLLRLKAKLLRR